MCLVGDFQKITWENKTEKNVNIVEKKMLQRLCARQNVTNALSSFSFCRKLIAELKFDMVDSWRKKLEKFWGLGKTFYAIINKEWWHQLMLHA